MRDKRSEIKIKSRSKGWRVVALISCLLSLVCLSGFEQIKLAMERALEDRIQTALGKLMDPDQFLVIVKVEPFTVEEMKQKEKFPGGGGPQYVLPGIPERKSLERLASSDKTSADVSALFWQSRPLIKRLVITLFLDKRIPSNTAQEVEVLVKQLVDFSPARNDEFKLQRISPRRAGAAPEPGTAQGPLQSLKITMENIKERNDFYWLALAAGLCTVLVVFLFGPALYFLKKLPRILQQAFLPESFGGGTSGGSQGAGTGGGAGGPGRLQLEGGAGLSVQLTTKEPGHVEVFLGEPEKQPYSFLNEKDIVSILLLMKEEPPLHLAIIAYHLRPDLAAAMISGLDSQTRKQVVEHLAAPQVLMRDEVKSLGQSLKQKVRGVIYGVDQYFAIYDSAAPQAQGELMKALEAQTPALVEKMRNEMFTFDDLVALDSNALRVVFREVPLWTLATALMGSAVALRDRVLGVLPSGASEIIRQEIEMNAHQSPKAIEDERKKIVHVVRRLVWDKKIALPPRQRGGGSRAAAPPTATVA